MTPIKGGLGEILYRWIILAILLLFVWSVMAFPALGEAYARKIYPLLSVVLSRFSSLFPFSIGDCFIYGSITGLLAYLVYASLRRRPWKQTLGRTIEYLSWVYVWFYLAWGLNYFRADFFTRTETTYVAYSSDQFKSFLTTYTDSLNASFISFEEIDKSLVSDEAKKGYREIAGCFGLNQPAGYLQAKPMLVTPLMSGVGVLGYMGPFFHEYNLNPDLLPVQYPFTYAHEMAHVLGIANEAEANLYGFLVCTRSHVPEIRFSGYFGLFTYVLGNAYQLLDEAEFNKWLETVSPEVKELYNKKVAYWQSLYSPTIGKMQDTAYNWFLKGNNIPSGKQNYSEVLALLIALEKQTAMDCVINQKELKVLAWNVWHAGHSKAYPQKGCEGTIGILKQSQADVILMIETYGAASVVADSLGYPYYLISDNLCIYSRYPITKKFSFPDQIATFNFGGVEIDVGGTLVRIFDTWIHYLPDARLTPTDKSEAEILAWEDAGTRDDEIRTILSLLKPMLAETDSIPIIMGGDFNSHSHLDWTDATKNMYNHGGAIVNWTVSKEMEKAKFKDSFREINPDPVKNIGVTWLTDADSLETVNRQDRIDFIYYQGKTIQAVASDCYDNILGEQFSFKGEDFFYASDHGFVLTTFKILNK